ncbi:MAG TPA: hypothetical protein VGI66_03510 [Streptosporangiaceae bacterium]|jgi:ribosomal protein L37AE/L43A
MKINREKIIVISTTTQLSTDVSTCPFCGDTDTRPFRDGSWYCVVCHQHWTPEPELSPADLAAFADAIEDYTREYAQDGAR